jgi:hypothetical protein
MADPFIFQAQNIFTGTLGSTDCIAGDMLYFDGTDWELADATDNTKFAEAMAVVTGTSGEVIPLCTGGILQDTDASYTQADEMYLSTTAGDITATRPTGANNLVQVVGFALSTSLVRVEIGIPKEIYINVTFPYGDNAGQQEAATESNDFGGASLIAANAEVYGSYMVPQNTVGVEIAYLWWVADATALDASDTYTIDVAAGVDDEATTTHADGIAAAALTVDANDLNRADVSAAFDGAGQQDPGNCVGVNIEKAAEGSAGDDPGMLNCTVVLKVV